MTDTDYPLVLILKVMQEEQLKQLVETYRPNISVLSAMKSIRLLGTVGPTATGKTTIMRELNRLSSEFDWVMSETSRPTRQNEKTGEEYLFRTKDDILHDAQQGNLVQIAIGPNGQLYCSRIQSYPEGKIGLLAMVPAAVKQFRRLPIGSFQTAFIVPHTYEAWQKYLTSQVISSGWTTWQLRDRLKEARVSFEFALSDPYMRFILNDKPEDAARRLLQVVTGVQPDHEEEARQIAASSFEKLKEKLKSYG